jgi:phosphoglycerate dehydrogenase-like enzyme
MSVSEPTVLLYTRRGDIKEYEQEIIRAHLPIHLIVCNNDEAAISSMPQADIVFGVNLPAAAFARAERLQWIQSMWAGVESFINAPIPSGVIITKPPGVFNRYISQYVFGAIKSRARPRSASAA